MQKTLGIDLASASWADNGTALLTFDEVSGVFTAVDAPALRWPSRRALTAQNLAHRVHAFVRKVGVVAVALDGPQGWRDPATPEGTPGVGRRCEYASRTQGKTGVHPRTYPTTQRPWIEFCVDVFHALLAKPGVELANSPSDFAAPARGYVVLECNPTSAWRSSGLLPLPAKRKRPALQPWVSALRETYALPELRRPITSHDDLQALVAALCAASAVAGPAVPLAAGTPSFLRNGVASPPRRLEGLIWNVRSRGRVTPVVLPSAGDVPARRRPKVRSPAGAALRVTQKVIDHANRGATGQEQIAFRELPQGTRSKRIDATVLFRGGEYPLVIGDASAIWLSHQTDDTRESFEYLFATLSDEPDDWKTVELKQETPAR